MTPGSCAGGQRIPVRVRAAAACGPICICRAPTHTPPTPHPYQHPRRTIWIRTSHRSSARRPRSGRSGSGRSLCMPPKVSAAAPTRATCARPRRCCRAAAFARRCGALSSCAHASTRRAFSRTTAPRVCWASASGCARRWMPPTHAILHRGASAPESPALQPQTLDALEPALT